jgi:alpha-ketoglutarate-dependent taurine dioxygenase
MSPGKYPVGATDKLKADKPMKIKTLKKSFVVQISDIDLSQPLNEPVFAALQQTIDAQGIAAFRGQFFDDESLVALAE